MDLLKNFTIHLFFISFLRQCWWLGWKVIASPSTCVLSKCHGKVRWVLKISLRFSWATFLRIPGKGRPPEARHVRRLGRSAARHGGTCMNDTGPPNDIGGSPNMAGRRVYPCRQERPSPAGHGEGSWWIIRHHLSAASDGQYCLTGERVRRGPVLVADADARAG